MSNTTPSTVPTVDDIMRLHSEMVRAEQESRRYSYDELAAIDKRDTTNTAFWTAIRRLADHAADETARADATELERDKLRAEVADLERIITQFARYRPPTMADWGKRDYDRMLAIKEKQDHDAGRR